MRTHMFAGCFVGLLVAAPAGRADEKPQNAWKVTEVQRFEAKARDVGFSPDGKLVVGVSWDLELSEWEVATGKRVRHQPAQDKHQLIAISADFKYGISVHRPKEKELGQLHLWDLTKGKSAQSWAEPVGAWEIYAPSAALSLDGTSAVTLYREPFIRKLPNGNVQFGGEKKEVFLWDTKTGREVIPMPIQAEGKVAYSPNCKWLVTDDSDKNVIIWDAATRKSIRKLTGAPGLAYRLSVSADHKYLVVSCGGEKDYPVVVWDANTGKVLHKLTGQKTFVSGLTFAPDGRTLLCAERGDAKKRIPPVFRQWDLATGRQLGEFEVAKVSELYDVEFSPDGNSFVSTGEVSEKRIIQVWKVGK